MPPKTPKEPPLDRQTEARVLRELAAIKKQTNAKWQDENFWSWLFKRLTFQGRRKDQENASLGGRGKAKRNPLSDHDML